MQGKSTTASHSHTPHQAKTHLPSLNEYPLDPFQMRVSGSTTSLIFSKYGQPIDSSGFYRIITWAQYVIIQGVIKSRGDGPVPAPIYEWSHGRLNVKIVRPLASQDLTWLMLANSLEGLKDFFDEYGWFVCQITVLDDTLGPVATGSVEYG